MVLLIAIFIGLLAGLIRARVGKREYRFYDLRYAWLVFAAFLVQFLAFYLPTTRDLFDDQQASTLLVSSLVFLFIFAILNIKNISFLPILTGFLANFLVIILNGGFMPISPNTINRLIPAGTQVFWTVGERLGTGKDIVLLEKDTTLRFLSDCLVTPRWLNFPVAFSIGDVLISLGVIWLLWSLGGPRSSRKKELKNE